MVRYFLSFFVETSILIGLIMSLLVISTTSSETEKILKGYTITPEQYEGLKNLLETIKTSEGNFSYFPSTQRMLVYDIEQTHKQIQKILDELTGPAINIRIQVDFLHFEHLQNQGFRITGTIVNRKVSAEIHTRSQQTTREENQSMTLLTANNSAGMLWDTQTALDLSVLQAYQLIPFQIIQIPSSNVSIITPTPPPLYRDIIGCSLWVRPTVVSPQLIEIELIPVVKTKRTEKGQELFMVREIRTKVIVQDGQRFFLGGVQRDFRDFFRKILSPQLSENTIQQSFNVYLTPKIERLDLPSSLPVGK